MEESGGNPQPIFTPEVAELPTVNMKHRTLINLLYLHPELKPAKNKNGDYIWYKFDIDRLIAHRATHKGGKLRKQ